MKNKPQLRSYSFEAIGTVWSIAIDQPISDSLFADIQSSVAARIETFDKTYSRFRSDSLVTRMSHKAGSFELPQDALPLIKFYRQLYDATNGKVTPFIGSVLEQAGYDANYTFNVQALTTPPAWDDVMSVRGNRLTLSRPAMLDFGAAGKGYLADIVVTLLTAAGIDECTVDAGGDIYNHSATQQRQRVALEHPLKLDEAIGVATISNQSICASAGNRRAWDDFHHIIDPELLVSPRQILACWIVADTAMLADGLATAVYFVKPDTLQETFKFEYALLNPDMSLDYSRKFPAELFTT